MHKCCKSTIEHNWKKWLCFKVSLDPRLSEDDSVINGQYLFKLNHNLNSLLSCFVK
jgi:hypothetical protein